MLEVQRLKSDRFFAKYVFHKREQLWSEDQIVARVEPDMHIENLRLSIPELFEAGDVIMVSVVVPVGHRELDIRICQRCIKVSLKTIDVGIRYSGRQDCVAFVDEPAQN